MSENYPEKLMVPQIRRAPDYERLKLIIAILMLALILVGCVFEITVYWGAEGQ